MLVSNIYRYKTLQNLLENKWFEADKETVRLILEISGQAELEELRPEEVAQIDCSKLQVIDRLWLNYSDERFGLSIQTKIYRDIGGDEYTASTMTCSNCQTTGKLCLRALSTAHSHICRSKLI